MIYLNAVNHVQFNHEQQLLYLQPLHLRCHGRESLRKEVIMQDGLYNSEIQSHNHSAKSVIFQNQCKNNNNFVFGEEFNFELCRRKDRPAIYRGNHCDRKMTGHSK